MDENADQTFLTPPEDRKRSGVSSLIPPFVWLIAIFLVGVILGNMLWLLAADVLAFGREDQSVTVTVSEDFTLSEISKTLKENGLIKYPWLFRLYAKITHAADKIKPGTYTLQTRYDYHAVVKALSSRKVERSAFSFGGTQGDRECLNWNC